MKEESSFKPKNKKIIGLRRNFLSAIKFTQLFLRD
jgi:hypothetical protein